MRIMTKEFIKDLEFHDLLEMLKPVGNRQIPFVFTNGGAEGVAKEDLHTIKTDFNLSADENEISFVMIPETYSFELDLLGDGKEINAETRKNDFLYQYVNNLRIISYLPEDILKLVKNKKLLALGYAEKVPKKAILKYIRRKYMEAFDKYVKCCDASVEAEEGLTIHEQFKNSTISHSLIYLLDGAKVTKVQKIKDEIHLTIDYDDTIVFSGAEIIEEEVDIVNSNINVIELYNESSRYELHFLIEKTDKNFIKHYYNVTYAFKDLKLID